MQQLNIQSSGLKFVKLSYLVGGTDRNNVSLELLATIIFNTAASELFLLTSHAVKHKL